MSSTVGRGVKRVGTVLALAVAVMILLALVVRIVPQSLLPVYLGGWVLVAVTVMLQHSEIRRVRRAANEPPYATVLRAAEVLALFAFGLVGFRGFFAGQLALVAAALVGMAAAFYDITD
jgi:hypothetical protein